MLINGTPVEDHTEVFGLWVKREDLSCPPPGPPFSKMRGVVAHLAKRPEAHIGVLDTRHSQAGHAVAYACSKLGKRVTNFYPEFKHEPGPRAPQRAAVALGANLYPLKAGRSAILYHRARKVCDVAHAYLMPNALKLEESIEETEMEVLRTDLPDVPAIIVSASSATIASGVMRGLQKRAYFGRVIVHLGYTRSLESVTKYIASRGVTDLARPFRIVDEVYAYSDKARPGPKPAWPCNEYYDLKAFRWWMYEGRKEYGTALLWNIG